MNIQQLNLRMFSKITSLFAFMINFLMTISKRMEHCTPYSLDINSYQRVLPSYNIFFLSVILSKLT